MKTLLILLGVSLLVPAMSSIETWILWTVFGSLAGILLTSIIVKLPFVKTRIKAKREMAVENYKAKKREKKELKKISDEDAIAHIQKEKEENEDRDRHET